MKIITFLSLSFLVISVSCYAQIPNYVPTAGLQGFWPFSGNANDVSGNNYNGTVNGCTLATDRFNNANAAYSFNGSTNYISTPYAGVLGSNPRALSFWAKTTSLPASGCPVVVWGDDGTGERFDCGFNYLNGGGCTIDVAYAAITYNTPSSVTDNVWHHYVFQCSNPVLSAVEVYQDGVLLTQVLNTAGASAPINTINNYNVLFGHFPYTSPFYYSGLLDEVGIWDRMLTNCEIQQLYTGSVNTTFISATAAVICPGQSVVLTAQGALTYAWSTSATSASISVNPLTTTSYAVTGTTAGNCTKSSNITITVNKCTSVNELNNRANTIQISPNPTKGFVSLTGSECLSNVEIYNAIGNLVYKCNPEKDHITVDLSGNPAGVYFLKANSSTGTIIKKIILE